MLRNSSIAELMPYLAKLAALPEEASLELISSKWIPVLIYGLEACLLLKSDVLSLHFVLNLFFMKLLRTNSIDVVKQRQ